MIARVPRVILPLWFLLVAGALGAQTVRGRVVLPDSTTPAPGVVVNAIGSDGKTIASTLSTNSGDYRLKLPAPGRYELRALRIGFRPTVISELDVGANTERVQHIVLNALPVSIAAMTIRDRGDCRLSGRDADTFLQLWEQARAALTASRLAEQSGTLDAHLVRVQGIVDAMKFGGAAKTVEMDSANVREWVADRVFATTPVETLESAGYVRRRENGAEVYDAPGAEALLTDNFLQSHCFDIVDPPRDHPEWIGAAFKPREARDNIVGVAGVLWLDRTSAELRRLEFEYANLPRTQHKVCAPPSYGYPRGLCQGFAEDGSNRFSLGGDMDFQRLPGGEWLVVGWTIRTPSSEAAWRRSIKVRMGGKGPPCNEADRVKSDPKPGDCTYSVAAIPRLEVVSTTVARLMRDGNEVYRDDSTLAKVSALAQTRAGRRPAHLEGVIKGADGRPLRNAIVATENPARVGLTDSLGVFRIRTLPPTSMVLTIRCRGYQPVRFTLPLLPDSTRRVSGAMVADSGAPRVSNNCSDAG